MYSLFWLVAFRSSTYPILLDLVRPFLDLVRPRVISYVFMFCFFANLTSWLLHVSFVWSPSSFLLNSRSPSLSIPPELLILFHVQLNTTKRFEFIMYDSIKNGIFKEIHVVIYMPYCPYLLGLWMWIWNKHCTKSFFFFGILAFWLFKFSNLSLVIAIYFYLFLVLFCCGNM